MTSTSIDRELDADSAPAGTMELSIVIPCLNEAETIGSCVEKAQRFIVENAISGEVIVSDNGSTDGSQAIAVSRGARVVPVLQKGYGSALLGGIASAQGRYIIMGDADDSYDLFNLMPFVAKLREGFDLVMGNRFQGGILPGAMPPLHRFLGNPVLSAIGRLFYRSRIGDFHCGLRGFSRAAVTRMDLRTTGMEFASEMIVKAALLDMRVAEVPTTLSPAGRTRPPHLNTWRDGWRHLRFLLLYSPRWLFFYPGIAMMFTGLALGLWLLTGPKILGPFGLDVQTLLYAGVAIIVGFQAALFAVFTKIFAISTGLLPEDPRLNQILSRVSLESGLAVGFILFVGGMAGSMYAVGLWGEVNFASLNPSDTMRVIVPSAVCLALGCQIIFSGFFLSVLGLNRR